MTEPWWTGVLVGAVVVGFYVGLRRWMHRKARRAEDTQSALRLTIGGMVVRMIAVLGLAALLLAVAPMHERAFGATLAGGLVLSVIAELARGGRASASRS
jgi:hypothetical protein